ncbi:hypothetical protein [Ornithinimicrobium flavum]|uniref:hypothetical protein n=1 Tax=Ornithinimicrobium flavum TaxID=1288636 RepID=UPI00106F444F|nr:hypothetical protein [Ornithinimicrobium flavum]
MQVAERPGGGPGAAPRGVPGAGADAGGGGGWVRAVVLAVLLAWALAGLAAWAGVAPSAGTMSGAPVPGAGEVADGDRQVVLVGVPGLTWDLVDEERTPTLARMARDGGAAALVPRGLREMTCAADAWLTLGAGERAGTDLDECAATGGRETPLADLVDDRGVADEAWRVWREQAEGGALGSRLGTLAEVAEAAGTCVAAHGAEAALGAARPDGSVAATPEEVLGDGSSACRIHLVSGPVVLPGDRSDQLPAVDAALTALLEEVPDGTAVVVAGMGQTGFRLEAQVLVLSPGQVPDGAGGWLSSGTTRQRGLVQLTDLSPTLLALAGVTPDEAGRDLGGAYREPGGAGPSDALAGEQVTVLPEAGDHVAGVQDLARAVTVAKWQAPYLLGTLVLVHLAALGAAVLLRRRAVRHGIPGVALAGTALLAAPVAAFLAGLVPWWRAGQPWVAGLAVTLLGAALVTAVAWAGPWRRDVLGPPTVVAALSAVVLGVDAIWSARLGLVSVLGLQPLTAGRFYGQGNVGFGALLGAVLVLVAAVLARVSPRRPAVVAVAALGLGAMLITAAPGAGADFGGVPALVVATGLLTLTALGLGWTALRLLGVILLGGLVGAVAMVLDWLRGPSARTHLGDFVQAVLDGEATGIVARKLAQSLSILVDYPLSWLAVIALVGVAVVALRRPAWSAPLWSVPGMSAVVLASLVAMALAWVLNDSGIAAVALTLTMLLMTGVSVLGRAVPAPPPSPSPSPSPGSSANGS